MSKIHFGNGNYKLRHTACGESLVSNLGQYLYMVKTSTRVNEVNCTKCILFLLKRQKYPNSKTKLWEARYTELTNKQLEPKQPVTCRHCKGTGVIHE